MAVVGQVLLENRSKRRLILCEQVHIYTCIYTYIYICMYVYIYIIIEGDIQPIS